MSKIQQKPCLKCKPVTVVRLPAQGSFYLDGEYLRAQIKLMAGDE
jgi:hypothetical protein